METKLLMLAPNNIFGPANGKPIMTPTQDITLGTYYLTRDPVNKDKAKAYKDYCYSAILEDPLPSKCVLGLSLWRQKRNVCDDC